MEEERAVQGLIGRKLGMAEVFGEAGRRFAVTVVEAGPCVVVQRKSRDKDGYEALQLGFGDVKESRVGKPQAGRFKKAGCGPKRFLMEFAPEEGDDGIKVGDTVGAGIFEGVQYVDVIGQTKGRGFQGVVKRYRMAGGKASHGSTSHRRIGSIGQRATPGKVNKGHRMPGHMGNVRVTVQNLRLVEVRPDANVILVNGAIPGPTGSIVQICKALKRRSVESAKK